MRADRGVLHRAALIQVASVRLAHDRDGPAIIALIERCWADYPGCVLYVDEEEPQLRALATYFAGLGGAVWIADEGAGLVATRPLAPGRWEICKVYVHPDHQGTGLAQRLMALAEGHSGGPAFELWSDTRFARAHRFYEKLGYVRGGVRDLGDRSQSFEYHYSKG